jgi:hypothetical protein
MKCPACGQEMDVKSTGKSYGHDDKPYDKTVYVCEPDDTWITLEVPV